jgi:epoxyqueuosine reductase
LGFDLAAIVPAGPPAHADRYEAWLAAGYHGEMAYMAGSAGVRLDPQKLAPGAASMIVVAARYSPGPPPPACDDPGHGRIARYAWGRDYHEPIKRGLHDVDAVLRARTGRTELGRACVDSAPLLERDFAAAAGLGFCGRNTCLISPGAGSWNLLGALLVPEALAPARLARRGSGWTPARAAAAARAGCGGCTRCLDACPTSAFAAPGVLDARRCISYLTIELRGPIPRDLRPKMGNWVFGCDVCQEVCPYDAARRAAVPPEPRDTLLGALRDPAPPLGELLALDEAGFREWFRGSAIVRARRRGLVRNACVAAGNSGDRSLSPALVSLLGDPEPTVRGHAAWALGRLAGPPERGAAAVALAQDSDPWVRDELAWAG